MFHLCSSWGYRKLHTESQSFDLHCHNDRVGILQLFSSKGFVIERAVVLVGVSMECAESESTPASHSSKSNLLSALRALRVVNLCVVFDRKSDLRFYRNSYCCNYVFWGRIFRCLCRLYKRQNWFGFLQLCDFLIRVICIFALFVEISETLWAHPKSIWRAKKATVIYAFCWQLIFAVFHDDHSTQPNSSEFRGNWSLLHKVQALCGFATIQLQVNFSD